MLLNTLKHVARENLEGDRENMKPMKKKRNGDSVEKLGENVVEKVKKLKLSETLLNYGTLFENQNVKEIELGRPKFDEFSVPEFSESGISALLKVISGLNKPNQNSPKAKTPENIKFQPSFQPLKIDSYDPDSKNSESTNSDPKNSDSNNLDSNTADSKLTENISEIPKPDLEPHYRTRLMCPQTGRFLPTENKTNPESHSCPDCNKQFTTAGNLKTHQKTVHEGIKDHHCELCDKWFGQWSHLKQHKIRHHNFKPEQLVSNRASIRNEKKESFKKVEVKADLNGDFKCEARVNDVENCDVSETVGDNFHSGKLDGGLIDSKTVNQGQIKVTTPQLIKLPGFPSKIAQNQLNIQQTVKSSCNFSLVPTTSANNQSNQSILSQSIINQSILNSKKQFVQTVQNTAPMILTPIFITADPNQSLGLQTIHMQQSQVPSFSLESIQKVSPNQVLNKLVSNDVLCATVSTASVLPAPIASTPVIVKPEPTVTQKQVRKQANHKCTICWLNYTSLFRLEKHIEEEHFRKNNLEKTTENCKSSDFNSKLVHLKFEPAIPEKLVVPGPKVLSSETTETQFVHPESSLLTLLDFK